MRLAINGFGRIGRNVFRAARADARKEARIVAVNDLADERTLAHLLEFDSVHGRMEESVDHAPGQIAVGGDVARVCSSPDPERLPWGELGVDVVVESTGVFRSLEGASRHLKAGARKVVITAPASGVEATIVMGVNHDLYDPDRHDVVSNASCTTNCLAPVAKVLLDRFGIAGGLVTTVHSYTQGQSILDGPHKDLRRARAAAVNMIPTTTGAARATALVLPELEGKMDGMAVRVPTPNVSLIDLVATLEADASKDDVREAMREAASGELSGILRVEECPLVSSDFVGESASSVVDGPSIMTMGRRMTKVVSWYDNEWGYACRVLDLARLAGRGLR